jgi:hypothetical protein
MESARRWSGFVCPDCRFVFRVPRDHDGHGVVCPSCRRMLRVPAAGDRPPPLVVPSASPPAEEQKLAAMPIEGKRRKKKSRQGENHAWDVEAGRGKRRRGSDDKRQMFWMLVGGSTLFALIVAVVLMAMLGGDAPKEPAVVAPDVAAPAAALDPSTPETASWMGDTAFVAVAKPLAEKFLDAKTVAEILPLLRNPEVAGGRLEKWYPDGILPAPGLAVFNVNEELVRHGNSVTVIVRTRDFDEKPLAFIKTPEGIRIDWESWAGWSEMPWDEFMASKPTEPKLFRASISPIEYYNAAFSDDLKWESHRLVSPDGMFSLYGYAERDSPLNSQLRLSPDVSRMPFTLMLKFPKSDARGDQVLIERIVSEGWVTDTE